MFFSSSAEGRWSIWSIQLHTFPPVAPSEFIDSFWWKFSTTVKGFSLKNKRGEESFPQETKLTMVKVKMFERENYLLVFVLDLGGDVTCHMDVASKNAVVDLMVSFIQDWLYR